MARVLFVYTNINGFHEDTYAFGLANIISVTAQSGHEVRAVIAHTLDEYQKVYDALEELKPQVVGFSTVSSQFHYVLDLAKEIKRLDPNVINVCGGVHPTIYPQCITETEALDAIFVGEAEEAFDDFMARVDRGESYLSCDNLAYCDNGRLVRNKQKPLVKDLDALPFPDRVHYPYLETIQHAGYAPFFFSRGCPFKCTYCSNHALARAKGELVSSLRYRSPKSCVQEIEETLDMYPSTGRIGIVDDIFGLNKKWRNEFLEHYKERIWEKRGVKFFCLLRADVVAGKHGDKLDFVAKLKESGCAGISFGVESGNEYIRNEVMGRGMSQETLVQAFKLTHENGLYTNALNIIGVPGETDEMIWDTIKLNRKIKPLISSCNIFYPYKGTNLGDYCFDNGLVDLEKFNRFSNERRETTLNYSPEKRARLTWYHDNWEILVYPYSVKKRLHKLIGKTVLWRSLRRAKRLATRAVRVGSMSRRRGVKMPSKL